MSGRNYAGALFVIKNKAVISIVAIPTGRGISFAIFRDGIDYVPDKPISVTAFKKARAELRKDPSVHDYRSRTPEEFAVLAASNGAAKKYSAAWFRKEIAFLREQVGSY